MKQFLAYRYEGGRREREFFGAADETCARTICELRGWHYAGAVEPQMLPPGHRVIGVIPAEQAAAMSPEDMQAMIQAFAERDGTTVH